MQKRCGSQLPAIKGAWPWLFPSIIVFVGLLPLTWFRGSVIAAMDYPFPLANSRVLLREALSTWGDGFGLGSGSPSFRLLTFALVYAGLDCLGLSPLWREGLLFVSWFMGAGLSAYFLIRVLVPGRPLAALLGGLFYMLNPYSMVVRWHELNLWLAFYAWAPLLLGLFAATLRTARLRYVLAFLFASLLLTPAHANVGSAALLPVLLGGYLVVHLWLVRHDRREVRRVVRASAVLAALWLGISLWWIAPTLISLRYEVSLQHLQETTLDRVSLASSASSLQQVLRLRGYWAFDRTHSGTADPIFPYARAYGRLSEVLSWLVPLFGAIGLWRVRRYPALLWPGVLWTVSSFFMKGLQPPFGDFTRWLYEALPVPMSLFRHPFDKFGMLAVLGLAPLVGIGLEGFGDLAYLIPRCRRAGLHAVRLSLVGLAALLLLVVLVWPFWTGDVIYGGGQVVPSFRTAVPPEYEQARSWLQDQSQGEFRILPLPLNRSFWTFSLYDWYVGYDLTRWLFGRPVMAPSIYRGSELVEPVVARLLAAPDPDLGQVLGLMNVKYVLLREDVNWAFLAIEKGSHLFLPREQMQKAIVDSEWLTLEAQFGSLRFYRNQAWRPMAAYATSFGVQAGAGESAYRALEIAAAPTADRVVFSAADAERLGLVADFSRPGSRHLAYTLPKARPWSQQLGVDSEGPFFVVLNQSYSQGWRAYYGTPNWLEILLGLGQSEGRHFLANGYANGWYFSRAGQHVLTLYYWPQTLLYAGIAGSATTWGLVLLAILYWRRARRMLIELFEAIESNIRRLLRFIPGACLRLLVRLVTTRPWRIATVVAGHNVVRHLPVVLILILHAGLGLTYSLIIPIGEAYDEWAHFAYIRHIVTEKELPASGQRLVPEIPFDQTHQPPLYYLLGAVVSSGIDMSDNLRPAPNTHLQRDGGGQNVFVHSQAGNWPHRGSLLGFRLVRGLSTLLSTITVLAGYLIASELLPGRRALATAALAFTAFMPQLIFMGSVVNNDIAATMFTALTTLLLVRIAVGGCSAQRLVLLSASVAGAVLSKTNTLGTLPAAGIVLGLSLLRKDAKPYRARMMGLASLLFMGILALLLAWELRNVHMHSHPGSIIGIINREIAPALRGETGPSAAKLSMDVLLYASEYAFRTFWGAFGWGNIPLDEWVYLVLAALTSLALIGTTRFFARRRQTSYSVGWLAVALIGLLALLTPTGFLLVTSDPHAAFVGRYFLPIAPIVGILLALGLADLLPHRARAIVLSGCTLGMLVLAVIVPFRYIRPAYAKPPFTTPSELARAGNSVNHRFDESIELVAYDFLPPNPRPGELVTVSLYWRCLASIDRDYSVIVQTLDPDHNFYGGVNTNLGFPLYPTSMWRPGDVLKQTHQFRLGATFPSPAFARVKVAVYASDGQRSLQAIAAGGERSEEQITFGRHKVASAVHRITRVPTGTSVVFGDAIRLRGYEVPAGPIGSGVLPVTLVWESRRPVSHDYTVFVHMVNDAGQIFTQADAQPLGGRYPTSLWTPGEMVWDIHELEVPAAPESEQYRLLVGLYHLETMERLPASDGLGHPIPANQFLLGEITIGG